MCQHWERRPGIYIAANIAEMCDNYFSDKHANEHSPTICTKEYSECLDSMTVDYASTISHLPPSPCVTATALLAALLKHPEVKLRPSHRCLSGVPRCCYIFLRVSVEKGNLV